MPKISEAMKENLKTNGCTGDIGEIEIYGDRFAKDLNIKNCTFLGKNTICGALSLRNATIENSIIKYKVTITDSIVSNSFIGQGTTIINFSVVEDTIISQTTLPKLNAKYISVINNSQISDDVILGGCDFNKTKSRGDSIFAFAHIGEGEFKRSIVIGSPPATKSQKTLVEIGHFGYYGDLLVLSFRAADKQGRSFNLDSKAYFESSKNALLNIFFGVPLSDNVTVEKGRTNIGAGTVISNYDPIRRIKAGAIILLSSIGANVSLSPYLTILPHSLIASGSVDITRKKNVILENSLVISVRSQDVILENYYDDNKKELMNKRSAEEMAYLQRHLSFLVILAEVCASGVDETDGFESYAWTRALKIIEKTAREIAEKSIPKYLELLKKSVECIEKITSQNLIKSEEFELRLYAHKNVLDKALEIKSSTEVNIKKINETAARFENSESFEILESDKEKADVSKNIILTEKQKSVAKKLLA